MAIQWFPGHMHKARKALSELVADIDVVIEMCDARLPMSSSNPMIAYIARKKPMLKILNKQDLADPAMTKQWIEWFEREANTRAIALTHGDNQAKNRIIQAASALAPKRGTLEKPLRLVIAGIPNVGKSTLINQISGRKIAKTGNEPAITKGLQRVDLSDEVILFDTPGMLWPKIEHEASGYALAASGAVGRNALDEEEVALELLALLQVGYPKDLMARYGLEDVSGADYELFTRIARRIGAVRSGGHLDAQKSAERILTDFREGRIGRVTLESPQRWEEIVEEIRVRQEQKAAEKAALAAEKANKSHKQ